MAWCSCLVSRKNIESAKPLKPIYQPNIQNAKECLLRNAMPCNPIDAKKAKRNHKQKANWISNQKPRVVI